MKVGKPSFLISATAHEDLFPNDETMRTGVGGVGCQHVLHVVHHAHPLHRGALKLEKCRRKSSLTPLLSSLVLRLRMFQLEDLHIVHGGCPVLALNPSVASHQQPVLIKIFVARGHKIPKLIHHETLLI